MISMRFIHLAWLLLSGSLLAAPPPDVIAPTDSSRAPALAAPADSRSGTAAAVAKADTGEGRKPAAPDSALGAVPEGDSAAAARADSGTVDTAGLHVQFYEYIAYPFLQALIMPVELTLVPAVKMVIFPIKGPISYILNNNVIDRTINLISFGEGERIMLYPTINLAPGTGSYTGLTLRHQALFGRPTEKLVAMGNIYVNGDWKFRSYMTTAKILGSGFDLKSSIQFNRVKNTSANQPGTNAFWYFADTSNVMFASLSHGLFEKLGAKATFVFRDNHYGRAPPQKDTLVSDFFPRNAQGLRDASFRGLEKEWVDRIFAVGLFRDTRNNQNITLAGTNFSLNGNYHYTNASHDYYGWEGTWNGYFKLGKERYEITAEEERKAGSMNIKKILKQVEMRKLREQIFSRKVVALHLYAAQSFEIAGNNMPVYGLNTLGNDTPLRGYGGSRFRDYAILSASAEYRFPVIRLLDGIIFNEYGVYGRDWGKIDYLGRLRNSWGFGVNVRRPDIFLFRVHAGFHGLNGIQLNMSVDSNY